MLNDLFLMEVTQWYAIALGVAVGVLIPLLNLTGKLFVHFHIDRTLAGYWFRKYVHYQDVHHYMAGGERTTWCDAMVISAFLAANVCCATFKVRDVSALSQRAGKLSIINLVPMPLGASMNLIADYCGVETRLYAKVHRWLGRAVFIHGFVHVVTALSLQSPHINLLGDIPGLTAGIALVVATCASLAILRRSVYEVFLVFHRLLVITIMIALYLHTPRKRKDMLAEPTVYLLAALCLEVLCRVLQVFEVCYRNISPGKSTSRATVKTLTFKRPNGRDMAVTDAVHVHVRTAKDWQPKAGQYVYLRLFNIGLTTWTQSHPFYVSWWYTDAKGQQYVVLVVQRRRGFTKRLLLCANDNPREDTELRALVQGPYGTTLRLHSYRTVLLFATGIGIAGQLPHLKQLMDDYHSGTAKARKVALFWELKYELHAAWVADLMHELLQRDSDLILSIHLFVQEGFISSQSRRGDTKRLGERIRLTYTSMNVQDIISSELQIRKGRTVVSISTNVSTARLIRKTVRSRLDKDIDMVDLEFTPPKERKPSSWWKFTRKSVGKKRDTETAPALELKIARS